MDMTKDELVEHFQLFYTQQQQLIDISMLILKNHNEMEADLLDYAHNVKNVFLSDLSGTEFDQLLADFRSSKIDGN